MLHIFHYNSTEVQRVLGGLSGRLQGLLTLFSLVKSVLSVMHKVYGLGNILADCMNLVTGLKEEKVDPELLVGLFCIFGVVVMVGCWRCSYYIKAFGLIFIEFGVFLFLLQSFGIEALVGFALARSLARREFLAGTAIVIVGLVGKYPEKNLDIALPYFLNY